MTQLVELQQALPKFRAAGIKLYAVSYDEVDALAAFAHHHDITYPLLSDEGSRVIDELGIRNHFVTPDQVPYYGIPFPGTYLVDEHGVVTAKFFHRNLSQRTSADAVIDDALGEILLGEDEPQAGGGDDDIRVTAAYHGGGGTMKSGFVRSIVVRFELAPGLHLYDDPVPEGMVATKIRVTGPPGLHMQDTVAPASELMAFPVLGVELHVWHGRVDFTIPVWVDDRIAGLLNDTAGDEVPIEIQLEYQACDDNACHIPRRETLLLSVPVAAYVGNDLAGTLTGVETTSMDARKFLRRQILRGLRTNPLQGLRYLTTLQRQLRRGPTGGGASWLRRLLTSVTPEALCTRSSSSAPPTNASKASSATPSPHTTSTAWPASRTRACITSMWARRMRRTCSSASTGSRPGPTSTAR